MPSMLSFLTAALLLSSSKVVAQIQLGSLTTRAHDVEGSVWALSDKVIEFRNFRFDGLAPAAFFWGDVGGTPSAEGFILPSPDLDCNEDGDLPMADGTVTWRAELPDGYDLTMLASISVWCEQVSVSFGDLVVPTSLDFSTVPSTSEGPALECNNELVLGSFTTRAHDVEGTVVALSDRVLEIRNFKFDGLAPAAFIYASGANPPTDGGLILLSPAHGCTDETDLQSADGSVTLRAELPPGSKLSDFAGGSISVWCEAVSANFGEVAIPADLTVPDAADGPALQCFTSAEVPSIARTPQGYNCESLNDDYQVRWQVEGNMLAIELLGRIDDDEYMGFGRSGADDRTLMVGADPIVADFFEGSFRARDFYITAQAQCSVGTGVCPDENANTGVNDVGEVSGERESGVTLVRYKKPILPSNVDLDVAGSPVDGVIAIDAGISTYVVWAIGPVDAATGLPFFHSNDFARTSVSLEFGRPVMDNCEPLLDPVDPNVEATLAPTAAPIEPFFLPIIRETTEITARIGPSAGDRGYTGVTGLDAWGIAWYLNDILIPLVEIRRGTTYTFLVNGGDDPTSAAQHHPFYLTDSLVGGYTQISPSDRAAETVYAGIEITEQTSEGVTAFTATAQGPICEYTGSVETQDALEGGFPDFFDTLNTECSADDAINSAAVALQFTPDETTPDLLYYQCVTHRNLGWEIRVIDADAPSILQVSCDNLRDNPIQITDEVTLNAVIDPFGATMTIELIYDGVGWLAMGFTNGQALMPGSEAVIGLPGTGNVEKYNLNARDISGVVPMDSVKQTLINATIVQEDGQTILSFTKLLREEGEHSITTEGANTFLYAFGFDNNLGVHEGRGGFMLEPFQCVQILDGKNITPSATSPVISVESSSLNRGLWVAHGVCASVAWVILIPLAIGSSVIRKLLESMGLPLGAWYQIHRGLNGLAIVLTIIAFALAVHALNESGVEDHFSLLTHHTIGLVIFVASVVQGLNGMLRPHLPSSPADSDKEDDAENGMANKTKNALMKSVARVAWECGHRFIGVGLLACAWWQVQSGLELFALRFNEEDLRAVFWGVALGITGLIFLLYGYQRATVSK